MITYSLVAKYRLVGDTIEQSTPAVSATCGQPTPPTNLVVTCVPEETGTGAIATATWVQARGGPGREISYATSSSGSSMMMAQRAPARRATQATTSASTTSGEYQQGETARFRIRAVFTDTNSGPDATRESEYVTANGQCAVTPMSPVLSLTGDHDGVDASWSISVPQNVTITGYSYHVMFSRDEEEVSDTVEPDVLSINIPTFGEVVTVTVVAHYTVVGDPTARDTAADTASCGIPHPITNLLLTCAPDQTGTGAHRHRELDGSPGRIWPGLP